MIVDEKKIIKEINRLERVDKILECSEKTTINTVKNTLIDILDDKYSVDTESVGTFKDKLSNIAMLIRNIGKIALSLSPEEKKEVDEYFKNMEKI